VLGFNLLGYNHITKVLNGSTAAVILSVYALFKSLSKNLLTFSAPIGNTWSPLI
jgi:hypothetical protein